MFGSTFHIFGFCLSPVPKQGDSQLQLLTGSPGLRRVELSCPCLCLPPLTQVCTVPEVEGSPAMGEGWGENTSGLGDFSQPSPLALP